MTYNHKVALNIRSGREARGYSQDYMAAMLNICQSSYANLELGKTTLSIDRLMRISEILDVDIHQLIGKTIYSQAVNNPMLNSNLNIVPSKEMYDQLILELKDEIHFLRGLVKGRSQ